MELDKLKKQIKLLEKAFITLKNAFEKWDLNELEKDWVIQRFEYTIELSWKTWKKFLEYKWTKSNLFPKEVFKELYKMDLVEDLQLWNDFLDARNSVSHLYSEYISSDIFDFIKEKYIHIWNLIDKLKKYI